VEILKPAWIVTILTQKICAFIIFKLLSFKQSFQEGCEPAQAARSFLSLNSPLATQNCFT